MLTKTAPAKPSSTRESDGKKLATWYNSVMGVFFYIFSILIRLRRPLLLSSLSTIIPF
jgi:hypothetical protein